MYLEWKFNYMYTRAPGTTYTCLISKLSFSNPLRNVFTATGTMVPGTFLTRFSTFCCFRVCGFPGFGFLTTWYSWRGKEDEDSWVCCLLPTHFPFLSVSTRGGLTQAPTNLFSWTPSSGAAWTSLAGCFERPCRFPPASAPCRACVRREHLRATAALQYHPLPFP